MYQFYKKNLLLTSTQNSAYFVIYILAFDNIMLIKIIVVIYVF